MNIDQLVYVITVVEWSVVVAQEVYSNVDRASERHRELCEIHGVGRVFLQGMELLA